jgi:hypothetical protein
MFTQRCNGDVLAESSRFAFILAVDGTYGVRQAWRRSACFRVFFETTFQLLSHVLLVSQAIVGYSLRRQQFPCRGTLRGGARGFRQDRPSLRDLSLRIILRKHEVSNCHYSVQNNPIPPKSNLKHFISGALPSRSLSCSPQSPGSKKQGHDRGRLVPPAQARFPFYACFVSGLDPSQTAMSGVSTLTTLEYSSEKAAVAGR